MSKVCVKEIRKGRCLSRLYERWFRLLKEESIVVESRRTLGRDQLMTHVSGDLWGLSGEDQGRKTISLGIDNEQIQASWRFAWLDTLDADLAG